MSRTYRRKNYETNSRKWGARTSKFGYYSEWLIEDGVRIGVRPMSKQEVNKAFWHIHGESSHRNAWSPGWEYRLWREKRLRMYNKQELHKWFNNPDYEPLCDADPLSHKWDWR